jgi:hypothetical protein
LTLAPLALTMNYTLQTNGSREETHILRTSTLEDMGTEGANPEQANPGETLR